MQQPTDAEPKQKTAKGYETPVPKRRDVMDALRKLVHPVKKPKPWGNLWRGPKPSPQLPPPTKLHSEPTN